jgi:signal-transduction protein with cAMP-binding, CBS, and nucleotidyltransferase domain
MLSQSISTVMSRKEIQDVLSVKPEATIAEAAEVMNRKGVGAIVVRTGNGPVEGIFTERDLLRRVVAAGVDPKSTRMEQVMTANVRTISAKTTVEEALRLMVGQRYRHLLVQDGANVSGLISVRDLMSFIVQADRPIAAEGRVGVERARMREAVQTVSGKKA